MSSATSLGRKEATGRLLSRSKASRWIARREGNRWETEPRISFGTRTSARFREAVRKKRKRRPPPAVWAPANGTPNRFPAPHGPGEGGERKATQRGGGARAVPPCDGMRRLTRLGARAASEAPEFAWRPTRAVNPLISARLAARPWEEAPVVRPAQNNQGRPWQWAHSSCLPIRRDEQPGRASYCINKRSSCRVSSKLLATKFLD